MFGEYHRRTESPKQCLQRHLSGMFVNTGVACGSSTPSVSTREDRLFM